MLDSLASFFGGNQVAFIGGFHSLLQDATGCLAYLDSLQTNGSTFLTLAMCGVGDAYVRLHPAMARQLVAHLDEYFTQIQRLAASVCLAQSGIQLVIDPMCNSIVPQLLRW